MIYYKILSKGEMISCGCTPNDIGFKFIHSECLKNGTLLMLICKSEYEKIEKEAKLKKKEK